MRRIYRSVPGALALAGFVLACGSEEPLRATGPRMAEEAAPATASPDAVDNHAPRIERVHLRPFHPVAGEPIRAVVEAEDPDGDPLRFRYVWSVNGRPRTEASAEIRLLGVGRGNQIEVEVTASDGRLTSAPATAHVRLGNRPPQLDRVGLSPTGPITAGTRMSALAEARDSDGDPLEYTYVWRVNGKGVEGSGANFSTGSLRRGDTIQVQVSASDGEEETEAVSSPIARVENAPPRITSQPTGVEAGGTFRYALKAEDPDGDSALRYRLVRGPDGMELDGRGEITWQPRPEQSGRHPVEIVVEDGHGGRSAQRFELIIAGAEGSPPPASPPD